MSNKIVEITKIGTFDAAIELSNTRRNENGGFGIFDGYTNCINGTKSLIARIKDPRHDFMVATNGDIYWVAVGIAGELLLNKIELHSIMDDSPLGVVHINTHQILFPIAYHITKSMKARVTLASTGLIFASRS